MTNYPVTFEATQPARYDRMQVLLRVFLLLILAMLGGSLALIYVMLYLALPIVAAALVNNRRSDEFRARGARTLEGMLGWIVGFYAYLGFLTDAMPSGDGDPAIRFDVAVEGTPTPRSALMRWATSIPGFLVGGLVGFIGAVVSVIAAVYVLVEQRVPPSVYNFQCGAVRWQARLFAYHASLVEQRPPLVFESGPQGLPIGSVL